MKVDFRTIEVENIKGEIDTVDLSKELGNVIYNQSKELGEVELAREMYKNGFVELATIEHIEAIDKYISFFPYFITTPVHKILEQAKKTLKMELSVK